MKVKGTRHGLWNILQDITFRDILKGEKFECWSCSKHITIDDPLSEALIRKYRSQPVPFTYHIDCRYCNSEIRLQGGLLDNKYDPDMF